MTDIRNFLREAAMSGLFAEDEIPHMQTLIARSRRQTKHVMLDELIIEETLDLLDRYEHAISKNPDLQAYLLERMGNAVVQLEQEKQRLGPEIAKQKRKQIDAGEGSELSSFMSGLSRLDSIQAKPMQAM
jgi:hypothetical protein